MVLKRPFHCPTVVAQGQDFDEALAGLLDGKSWVLVTSAGWLMRGAVGKIQNRCGPPRALLANVCSNPDVPTVVGLADELPDVDTVVALGGGSVIDAAKGAVALKALSNNLRPFMTHLRDGEPLPDSFAPIPIIAVPTTSGTGSEVTCWGTIWGEDRIKHSVSHTSLYPSNAVLDPALCVSMPGNLTLATGLDALSHAMESVWNRRHTEVTDALAEKAIRTLRRHLLAAMREPNDIVLRSRVQIASLLSGLTMGTTQTAAAHSISYPFTAHFDVPHGLACSFTLPEIARYNMKDDPSRLLPIAEGLECSVDEIPEHLEKWFGELGVGPLLAAYVTPDVADTLEGNLITRSRAANNIRSVDEEAARRIARLALNYFCPASELDAAVNN
ncbi:MAG: phosphonoacetaldehyde reductase [Rhodospirillales bacterium]|nr:phosphonoacetaldehyde reductase [Rhodospirillales bacterium]